MARGFCFKFHARQHAVVVLLALEATLVFLVAQVPLFNVEIAEIARGQTCSSKPCWLFGPIFVQIPTPKATSQRLQTCNKCISRGAINRLGQRRCLFSEYDAS